MDTIVNEPTLPANIITISIILPISFKLFEPARDKPTVAYAEVTSKVDSKRPNSSPCVREIRYVPTTTNIIANTKTPIDFLIVYTSILLLKAVISVSFFKNPFNASIRTAKVVVFIPPPVDAGDAPININTIITNRLLSLNLVKSIVAKPAVLAVTD